ncbi:hypothetical protein [Lactobacillus sp. ESL0791]|uniref:hypothetical protein n=1 Tax=Lactobacillus sp. ESL0791 TaxID=2983234 RepID=UPI0035AB81B4
MIPMNLKIKSYQNITVPHNVVVQKGNVTGSNIYALQLLNKQVNTAIYKGSKATGNITDSPQLYLAGNPNTAGGHT